jgi:hypothetical protein
MKLKRQRKWPFLEFWTRDLLPQKQFPKIRMDSYFAGKTPTSSLYLYSSPAQSCSLISEFQHLALVDWCPSPQKQRGIPDVWGVAGGSSQGKNTSAPSWSPRSISSTCSSVSTFTSMDEILPMGAADEEGWVRRTQAEAERMVSYLSNPKPEVYWAKKTKGKSPPRFQTLRTSSLSYPNSAP